MKSLKSELKSDIDVYKRQPMGWRRKCLVNIAKAGMFSSDRTIAEYDRDIWHLGK